MKNSGHREGLRVARLLMVLSSISPLFILWAIRGNVLVSDVYFLTFCAVMVIFPNAFLLLRIRTAMKLNEKRELLAGPSEDHRDHLLVYLFAMLLPFYAATLETWRDLTAAFVALAFIVFLFWHLNLHYMNLLFASRGYRVFTVYPPREANRLSGKNTWVLITQRNHLPEGERLVVYRISKTVYLET